MSIRAKIYSYLTPLFMSTATLCTAYEYSDAAYYGEGNGRAYDFQPSFCQNQCGRFTLRADLLYWKPHISSLELDYGKTTISQINNDPVIEINSSEYDADPHFKWNSGFRLGAGYQFADSALELGAIWTHFQDSGNSSNHADSENTNRTKVGIKFNQIDLLLGYNIPSCSTFQFKPFLGIRGTRIDTHLKARLFTPISLPAEVTALESRFFNDKQRYSAVGPLLGIQGDWGIGCGFSLYGNLAASVLYGRSTVHFHDLDIFSAPFSQQFDSRIKKRVRNWDCNLDIGLGIRYDTCICNDYQVSFLLGVEHHEYFNQSRLGVDRGDLSFDGAVFSVSINL